ncbi:ABC-three component system protein [Lysinibacillus fusiformis]|uniref:ABC-three component system protein n=1 Tax=Lysinibacillus fusiformis TaxID=28031 RepID=UPI00380B0479
MLERNRNIQNPDANSLNNTGDNNNFGDTYIFSQKSLNRTYLYDFCAKFIELEDGDIEYSTEVPSDIEEKMDFNEIVIYKDIFIECDYYFDDVEAILREFPRRQRILTNINTKYKKFKGFNVWKTKDELCEQIFDSLSETVANDHNSINIMKEDVEIAIHSLMYYAFVKCKILDPLN